MADLQYRLDGLPLPGAPQIGALGAGAKPSLEAQLKYLKELEKWSREAEKAIRSLENAVKEMQQLEATR